MLSLIFYLYNSLALQNEIQTSDIIKLKQIETNDSLRKIEELRKVNELKKHFARLPCCAIRRYSQNLQIYEDVPDQGMYPFYMHAIS
jgi:hypothetical protein